MGRRHGVHIVDFPIRSRLALEIAAIPGGDAGHSLSAGDNLRTEGGRRGAADAECHGQQNRQKARRFPAAARAAA